MRKLFSGQLYLIDANIKRSIIFKEQLKKVNPSVFFNHFSCIEDAFNMALSDNVITPEYIYVHTSLADFQAREVLKKLRKLNKTKRVKVVVFGYNITNMLISDSLKYNFRVIKTYPENKNISCKLFDASFVGQYPKLECAVNCKCC